MQSMKVSKIGAVASTGILFAVGLAVIFSLEWLPMHVLVAWGDAITLARITGACLAALSLVAAICVAFMVKSAAPILTVAILISLAFINPYRTKPENRKQKYMEWWELHHEEWAASADNAIKAYIYDTQPVEFKLPKGPKTTQLSPSIVVYPGDRGRHAVLFPVTLFGFDSLTGFVYAPESESFAPWMVPNGEIVDTEKVGRDWFYVRANY